MTMPFRARRSMLRRGVLALALLPWLKPVGAQETAIWLEKVVRDVPGAEPRWQRIDPVQAGIRVRRGSRSVRPWVGMRLRPGDVLETGPLAAVVLRFGGSGTTVLDVETRVRIGSLEVFFGRVFANVRGFFQASSETVVAGVAGTRFLFQVRPDRATHVAVVDGAVTCTSRRGTWVPIRLDANEALLLEDRAGTPLRLAADPRALRDASEWARNIVGASAYGEHPPRR